MLDKNGIVIKTGDLVKIENGYFKSDNGYFIVENSPGDVYWSGNDYSLHKSNSKGVLSNTKYKIAFWPISITINSMDQKIKAKEHNNKYATIEVIK